jgi:cytochrome P450
MTPTGNGDSPQAVDIDEFYRHHFDYMAPGEPDMREVAVRDLAAKCPVTHSDAWGGFWVVNKYDLVRDLFQDWQTYSSVPAKSIVPRVPGKLPRPPVDVDPPALLAYRQMLLPYLTPTRVAAYEPGVRDLCTSLIDAFIEDGRCDLVSQFSYPFPGRMFYRYVLGIEDDEVSMVQGWQRLESRQPQSQAAVVAVQKWNAWMYAFVERRRKEPRRDDIVDALLHATYDGAPLTDEAVAGSIMVLIQGGFSTQTDALSNIVLRLAQDPSLQERLRQTPGLISKALDEFLRFDPPTPGRERLCTRDTVLDGQPIRAGDRVYMNLMASHRDVGEFSSPNDIDIDRPRNRHFAFGAGVHRCVGSNLARLNLRVALEELLSRLGPFHLTEGDSVGRVAYAGWGPSYLRLTFAGP